MNNRHLILNLITFRSKTPNTELYSFLKQLFTIPKSLYFNSFKSTPFNTLLVKIRSQIVSLLILTTLSTLPSCYQASEGELYEDYEKKIVIEAYINNQTPPYYVKVSYSTSPDDSVDFYPITHAKVSMSDIEGTLKPLERVSENIYATTEIQGMPGTKYHLNIIVDQQEYIANEIMPDSAIIYRYEVKYIYQYVPVAGNYIKMFIIKKDYVSFYKLDVTKNGTTYSDYSDLIIFDDAYANDTLVYLVPYVFSAGDSVTVDLNVISEDVFKYYYALKKQTTNTFSNIQTPLKNPPNNLYNQALGVFQASTITRLNVIISDSLQFEN